MIRSRKENRMSCKGKRIELMCRGDMTVGAPTTMGETSKATDNGGGHEHDKPNAGVSAPRDHGSGDGHHGMTNISNNSDHSGMTDAITGTTGAVETTAGGCPHHQMW